jgi:PAS domain S-box-containing protein
MKAASTTGLGRILVLAPQGRDAEIARALLKEGGITSEVCVDLPAFERALGEDTCFAVLTEDALRTADLRVVASRVNAQPAWSDLPFIILTQRGGGADRNSGAARLSDLLGNVTFLERPFHPTTFVSVARTAFKARQRQYEARGQIELLHESEERLRTALVAGHLGSWELDIAAGTLRASATFKALFGRSADDSFSYQDLIASVHWEERDRMQEATLATVKIGAHYATEFRTIWSDGTIHWAEIRGRHVRDGTTGQLRFVGVSLDITERKTTEGALKTLNETLEERVAERTAELNQAHAAVLAEIQQRQRAEEQLRQSQKMDMIGQLTGGVAHDFNNLLMVVLANLTLLGKLHSDDARTARLVDSALQGAQRGAVLTQRLLAFARRQELKLQPTNLADLLRGMSDLIERSAGSQIELQFDIAETLPPVLVDANQVELALLNLVVNARDAMPSGGILKINLGCTQAGEADGLPPGNYVRLTVSDNGEGMDSETLRKATEPFFSTKGLGKGTGLGLSMVHGLANQMNGALRLMSRVGQGTTAELWLPVTAVVAEIERNPHPTPMSKAHGPRIKVLVVDDDVLIAMSTVEMLEDLGHHALEAGSAAQALEILRSGEYVDLLITDYSMPKMNGADLAKAARKLRPGLPILLASGYAEFPSPAGIDLPRLGKPYRQDQLAAAISKVLGQDGSAQH